MERFTDSFVVLRVLLWPPACCAAGPGGAGGGGRLALVPGDRYLAARRRVEAAAAAPGLIIAAADQTRGSVQAIPASGRAPCKIALVYVEWPWVDSHHTGLVPWTDHLRAAADARHSFAAGESPPRLSAR